MLFNIIEVSGYTGLQIQKKTSMVYCSVVPVLHNMYKYLKNLRYILSNGVFIKYQLIIS